ncbi:hypothetical protein D081_1551 [Anaerovibrio sp. JC8]|uniref:DUF3329 domain-containing protein n=1 Tax=Anaerovibrio sp. JC8 TaxID=1240085 RepID=UPI000A0DB8BB|nr:DUF6056 family protein [Anaerovibrio sp. JC8]ORT99970.1 hypothetical protein D081_1551 [Anaerovibrio sp. JC8]
MAKHNEGRIEQNTAVLPSWLSWQAILLVVTLVFFVRNMILPLVSDDIPYAFIWDGADRGNLLDGVGERVRITSFYDIVVSQWSHYFTWGGRILGIGLTQFFAWQGKLPFNILNTVVFVALIFLMFRLGTGEILKSMNKTYMIWLVVAAWFFLPDPFLTILWMCGSCVYLWMALLECLFLLPYCLKYWHSDFWEAPPKWSIPVMAVSGLAAGWSVETGAAAVAFITFFALIYFWRQKQLEAWMVVGFIFLCIGTLMLTQAPGEMHRLALQREFEYNPALPPEMYWTSLMFYINFDECFWPVTKFWLPLLVPVVLYIYNLPAGQRLNRVTMFQGVFFAAALVVMIIMMFVPMASARAGFFPTVCLIILSLTALRELMPELEHFAKNHVGFCRGAFGLVAAVWLVVSGILIHVEWSVYEQWTDRIDYINARANQELVVVHQIDVPPIADELGEWCESAMTWNTGILAWGADLEPRLEGSHNIMYAQYYGWNKVITDGEDRRQP